MLAVLDPTAALLGVSCSKSDDKTADAGLALDLASNPAKVAEATINDVAGTTIRPWATSPRLGTLPNAGTPTTR